MTYYLLEHSNPAAPERGDGRYWGHAQMTADPRCVTVHTTEQVADLVAPDVGAEAVANYFATTTTPASYHTCVDSDSTVRLLPGGLDGTTPHVAFHCYQRNTGNLGVSIAMRAASWGTLPPTWETAALERAACETALWCARWDIPVKLIGQAEFDAGGRGISGHGILQPEDRTDPGAAFPWDRFLELVQIELDGGQQPTEDDEVMIRACVLPDNTLILVSGHFWTPMIAGVPWPMSHQALADLAAAGLLAKAPDGALWSSISTAALAQLVRVDRNAATPGGPVNVPTAADIAAELSKETRIMIGIPAGWASVVALFIPVLTALAVRERAEDNRVRALFGIALTGVVAVVGMLTDDTAQHTVPEIAAGFLAVYLPMVTSYLGAWKPILDVNRRLLPTRGL